MSTVLVGRSLFSHDILLLTSGTTSILLLRLSKPPYDVIIHACIQGLPVRARARASVCSSYYLILRRPRLFVLNLSGKKNKKKRRESTELPSSMPGKAGHARC